MATMRELIEKLKTEGTVGLSQYETAAVLEAADGLIDGRADDEMDFDSAEETKQLLKELRIIAITAGRHNAEIAKLKQTHAEIGRLLATANDLPPDKQAKFEQYRQQHAQLGEIISAKQEVHVETDPRKQQQACEDS